MIKGAASRLAFFPAGEGTEHKGVTTVVAVKVSVTVVVVVVGIPGSVIVLPVVLLKSAL